MIKFKYLTAAPAWVLCPTCATSEHMEFRTSVDEGNKIYQFYGSCTNKKCDDAHAIYSFDFPKVMATKVEVKDIGTDVRKFFARLGNIEAENDDSADSASAKAD